MKVLIIDNYDSFTYNLAYLFKQLNHEVSVERPDHVEETQLAQSELIVLSPGPGKPNEMPGLNKIIQDYASSKPMLGICLGHQAIAQHFGAELYNLEQVYHGVQDTIERVNGRFYRPEMKEVKVGRYHSWAIKNLPDELQVNAIDENHLVMSFEHKTLPLFGLQFHPESIMCPDGPELIDYFIKQVEK